jgi:hypothetical protein
MPTLRRLRTRVPKARAVTPTPVRLAIAGAAIGVLLIGNAGIASAGAAHAASSAPQKIACCAAT